MHLVTFGWTLMLGKQGLAVGIGMILSKFQCCCNPVQHRVSLIIISGSISSDGCRFLRAAQALTAPAPGAALQGGAPSSSPQISPGIPQRACAPMGGWPSS